MNRNKARYIKGFTCLGSAWIHMLDSLPASAHAQDAKRLIRRAVTASKKAVRVKCK